MERRWREKKPENKIQRKYKKYGLKKMKKHVKQEENAGKKEIQLNQATETKLN